MNSKEKKSIDLNYIPIKNRKGICKVYTKEILLIEKDLRLVRVYTLENEYSFYGKLDYVTQFLGKNFYKSHRSCILNLDKIIRMEGGVIYIEGDKWIKLGQRSYQHTRKQYSRYLDRNL